MNHYELLEALLKEYGVITKLARRLELDAKTISRMLLQKKNLSEQSKIKIENLAIEKGLF